MATADVVTVELRASVDQYMASINKAEANFSQKLSQMQSTAMATGQVMAIPAQKAATAFGKQIPAEAKKASTAIKSVGTDAQNTANQIAASAPRAGNAVRNLGYQTSNVAAQFQDIGVQLAGGASPFTIMSQQIPQITAATTSLGGVVRGLGLALTQLISPVGLVSAAFILGVSAVASYFRGVDEDIPKADKTLQNHDGIIRALKDAYGIAEKAVEDYADKTEQALTGAAAADQLKALGQIVSITAKALRDDLATQIDFVRRTVEDAEPIIGKLQIALDALTKTGDVRQFAADMRAIELDETVEKDVRELAARMRQAASGGVEAQKKYEELNGTLAQTKQSAEVALGAFAALTTGIIGVGSEGGTAIAALANKIQSVLLPQVKSAAQAFLDMLENFGKLQDMVNKTPLGTLPPVYSGGGNFLDEAALQQFKADRTLSQTDQANPKGFLKSRAVSQRIADRIDAIDESFAKSLAELLIQFPELKVVSARRTTAEQKAIYDSGVRPAAKPGNSLHEKGLAVDLGIAGGGLPDQATLTRIYQAAKSAGIIFPVKNDPFHAQPVGASGRSGEFSAAGGGATKKTPADLFKGSTEEIQRRIDLINKEMAATAGLTAGTDEYQVALARTRIEQQLINDALAAGYTLKEGDAAKIRQLADNLARLEVQQDSTAESSKRLADEQRAAADEAREFSRDVAQGFVQDLIDGKGAAEALGNALEKLAGKLLDLAFDQLFAAPGAGGGGGFLATLFSGLFKAQGGPVKKGQPYIVGERRPELFVPDSNGKILPSVPKVSMPSGNRGGAQSSGGFIRVSGEFAVQNGNLVPLITGVSGLVAGQQVKQANRNVPQRVAQSNTRGT